MDINTPEIRLASDQPDIGDKHTNCSIEETLLLTYPLQTS